MNKKLFNYSLLFINILYIIFLFTFSILGNINRIGYISELNFISLENGNYVYSCRIKYYSKIFRNSDIYNVYINNIENILEENNFIKDIIQTENGTPFIRLISNQKIYLDKIENIYYNLKLKNRLYILPIILILILLIKNINYSKLKSLLKKIYNYFFNKKNRINFIILISIINFILVSLLLSIIYFKIINKEYKSIIDNFELLESTELGYVYKIKIDPTYKDNFIYKINNKSINIKNINYFGYSVKITNSPLSSMSNNIFYTDKKTFIISNFNENINAYYDIKIPTQLGYKYKITIFTRQISDDEYLLWNLNKSRMSMYIKNYTVSNNYKIFTDIRDIITDEPSNLYFTFPKGITEIEYILIENINDKIIIFDNNYIIITLKNSIDNINYITYSFQLKNEFIVLLILIMIYPLLIYYIIYIFYHLLKNDKNAFIILVINISFILFIFHLWLISPGYYYDWDGLLIHKFALTNTLCCNGQPYIYQFIISTLFKIFGVHSYYLFIINLICFYCAFSLIIITLYLKFNKKRVILIYIIPIIIPDIFIFTFFQLKDYFISNVVLLFYSLIFCQTVLYIKNKYIKIILFITTIFLSIIILFLKQNNIVMIYPIFILLSYKIIKNNQNLKIYFSKFFIVMLIFAISLIIILKYTPQIFIDKNILESNKGSLYNTLSFNIGGIAYTSNDDTIIPKKWYLENKNLNDLKKSYSNAYYHNKINFCEAAPAEAIKIDNNAKTIFYKYVLKHPIAYLKFVSMIMKGIWFDKQYFISLSNPNDIQFLPFLLPIGKNNPYPDYDYNVSSLYPINEQKITFTNTKYNIYNFIYSNIFFLKGINNIIPISICIVIVLISTFIFLSKNKLISPTLVLTFCISFSGIAYAIVVILFTPSGRFVETRYLAPLFPISILSIISLITFLYEKKLFNIGK